MNDQDDDETIEHKHEGGAGEQPTTAPPVERCCVCIDWSDPKSAGIQIEAEGI
jgi:hypothetical protein